MQKLTLILIFLCSLTCFPFLQAQQIGVEAISSGYTKPVAVVNAGDDRLFIVEQDGYIKILHTNGTVTTFLDIHARVNSTGDEQGLLGLAFHPDYASNGYFYVNYINNSGNTRISRFSVTPGNPELADPLSESILLTITQPYSNHNGGNLEFGPDGYLYCGMGDGGSGGDPGNRAQDITSQLLGKMLRIDINSGTPYGIPPSNPFVGITGDDEIWAYGLRNPWRWSFDRLTGDLWINDVGQDSYEEVDFQPASSAGGENYGWRCYEGNHEYNFSACSPTTTFTYPIFEYTHGDPDGGYVTTGGYVYRGTAFPGLYGKYIFCDFGTGNWWTTVPDGIGGWTTTLAGFVEDGISSYGEAIQVNYMHAVCIREKCFV